MPIRSNRANDAKARAKTPLKLRSFILGALVLAFIDDADGLLTAIYLAGAVGQFLYRDLVEDLRSELRRARGNAVQVSGDE